MSIVRWNPAREIGEFFNRYEVGRELWGENVLVSDWTPAVDIRETAEEYRIEIELPAVDLRDVKVTLEDGILTVAGERKWEKEEKGRVHRVERRYGRFVRSFRVPEAADENRIEAHAENGVLTLRLHKREQLKPRSIEVKAA